MNRDELEIERSRRIEFGLQGLLPLIDIVFQLLIFFTLTSTFIQMTGFTVNPPEASSAKPITTERVVVTVTPSGSYRVDGRTVASEQLVDTLKKILQSREKKRIRVDADEASRVQAAVTALDAARKAGAHSAVLSTKPSQSSTTEP